MMLRLALGAIRAGNADAFAAFDQQLGKRKGNDQARSSLESRARCEAMPRRRTVGPQPHGVRGLPLLLADIEMIVARRAPPVDIACRLTGREAAVLPEAFARAGAPGGRAGRESRGRDATRLEHQTRQARTRAFGSHRRRAGLPSISCVPCSAACAINRSVTSAALSRRRRCGLRHARQRSAHAVPSGSARRGRARHRSTARGVHQSARGLRTASIKD